MTLLVRSGRDEDLEIVVLRRQMTVLRRQIDRPALTEPDRSLLGAIAAVLPRARLAGWLVTPDTLLRWHRSRIARHWTHPPRRPGRPPTAAHVRSLALRVARENPTWGYRRIHGELGGVGHTIGASTVWQILKDAGIDPAPNSDVGDLVTAAALPGRDRVRLRPIDTALLRRFYLLFFIDITTREVTFGGITTNPTAAWTVQTARNLFLVHRDKLTNAKGLVRDRGSQFTASSDEVFRTEGIRVLKTPVRAPVANSIAERWIGTLRRELLDRTITWHQRQLHRLVIDHLDHYNRHRPYRALQQRTPSPLPTTTAASPPPTANVIRLPRCDGLVNEYKNAA